MISTGIFTAKFDNHWIIDGMITTKASPSTNLNVSFHTY